MKKLTLTIIFNIFLFYKQKKGIIKIFSNISNNEWREDSNIFLKKMIRKPLSDNLKVPMVFSALFVNRVSLVEKDLQLIDRFVSKQAGF